MNGKLVDSTELNVIAAKKAKLLSNMHEISQNIQQKAALSKKLSLSNQVKVQQLAKHGRQGSNISITDRLDSMANHVAAGEAGDQKSRT